MNDEIFTDLKSETKTIFKAQQKQKKNSCCDVASLRYTSSSVDLSKLLLVTKVTKLPLDCVASLPHKQSWQPYPWKYSNKDNARK